MPTNALASTTPLAQVGAFSSLRGCGTIFRAATDCRFPPTLHPNQIPAVIRPVAVVYRGDPGLRLGPCTLGRILKGEATRWNDNAILVGGAGHPAALACAQS